MKTSLAVHDELHRHFVYASLPTKHDSPSVGQRQNLV